MNAPNKPPTEPKTKARSAAYVAAKLHTELAKAEAAHARAKADLAEKASTVAKLREELKAQPADVQKMVTAMGQA